MSNALLSAAQLYEISLLRRRKILYLQAAIVLLFCFLWIEMLVCYAAVFSVVMQHSSPQEHCVTTLKTAD